MAEFPDQLMVAEWHTSGGLNIPTVGQRTSFYGVSGVPHVRIDGIYSQIGASSCASAAANYRNLINLRLSQTGGMSPVRVEGAYLLGTSTVSMTVTFTLEDPVTLVSPSAYLIITENNILHAGTLYNHIVRAEYHQTVTGLVNPGDFVTVDFDFPINPVWNVDNIECLALLQNMSPTGNKEIYNSAHIPLLADFDFAWDQAMISVAQGNGTAEFEGTLTNISDGPDELTLTLNNTFGWPAEFMVEGEGGFHTTPSVVALGTQEQIQVYMRVETDAEVRIGEGYMVVQSAETSRTQNTLGRVFNGSPAILLVDDDNGTSPAGETAFITGLQNAGYLFDTWDVRYGHDNSSPEFEDMQDYNVVVWLTDWHTLFPVTADDAQSMMAFLDQGRGLFMSSQDMLMNFTAGDPFLTDYLGIDTWTNNVRAEEANGVGGDAISDGLALGLTYPTPTLNRADEVHANAIGTEIFTKETGENIAVRADNGTARTVTLTFAGAAIDADPNPNNLATLLDRSIEWIMQAQGQGVEERTPAFASRISLLGPNPLNLRHSGAEAAIRLRVSERASQSPVQVDVLDLNGRLVRNVINASLPAGVHTASWDGRDAAGRPATVGVYYTRLVTSEGVQGAHLVVLR